MLPDEQNYSEGILCRPYCIKCIYRTEIYNNNDELYYYRCCNPYWENWENSEKSYSWHNHSSLSLKEIKVLKDIFCKRISFKLLCRCKLLGLKTTL